MKPSSLDITSNPMRLQNWNPPVGTLGGTGFTYRPRIDPQPWWDQTSSTEQMVMTIFNW